MQHAAARYHLGAFRVREMDLPLPLQALPHALQQPVALLGRYANGLEIAPVLRWVTGTRGVLSSRHSLNVRGIRERAVADEGVVPGDDREFRQDGAQDA